jgi:hypothetical protein
VKGGASLTTFSLQHEGEIYTQRKNWAVSGREHNRYWELNRISTRETPINFLDCIRPLRGAHAYI